MLLSIIFSFNRAMQLDYLLQSVIKRFKVEYKIVIIYHTTGEHKAGYDQLKIKYEQYTYIKFEQRKKLFFDTSFLQTISNKENREFFFKKNFFKPNADNFKDLLQKTISNSGCEFVMFNTDDGYFFDDVIIPEKVFQIIMDNPDNASYRLYVGENLVGQPSYIEKKENYVQWDYYTEKVMHHWSFPFAVDGTIYNSTGLLKHLKKMAYHNPVTLEEFGVEYVKNNELFKIGLGPITSKLLVTKLNRVSLDSFNPTIHIKPEFLNEKFLDGYTLSLELPIEITNANVVPLKIMLVKGDEKEIIYTIDEEGETMQSLLGIEGAKIQVK